MVWTVIDIIEKSERCNKYSGVYIVGLTERESKLRYGSSSGIGGGDSSSDIDLELCYPGPIGFGTQRIGLSSSDLIRALRECGKSRGEKKYIGVELYAKSRDEMNSREKIVTDIFERYDLTATKVFKAIRSTTKKGRTVSLKLR